MEIIIVCLAGLFIGLSFIECVANDNIDTLSSNIMDQYEIIYNIDNNTYSIHKKIYFLFIYTGAHSNEKSFPILYKTYDDAQAMLIKHYKERKK